MNMRCVIRRGRTNAGSICKSANSRPWSGTLVSEHRHDSWENPFITAPLPYENLTAIWGIAAAPTGRRTLNSWNRRLSAKNLRLPDHLGRRRTTPVALPFSEASASLITLPKSRTPRLRHALDSWNATTVGLDGIIRPTAGGSAGARTKRGTSASPPASALISSPALLPAFRWRRAETSSDYREISRSPRTPASPGTTGSSGPSATRRASRSPPWATPRRSPTTSRPSTSSRPSFSPRCVGTSSFSAPYPMAWAWAEQ